MKLTVAISLERILECGIQLEEETHLLSKGELSVDDQKSKEVVEVEDLVL